MKENSEDSRFENIKRKINVFTLIFSSLLLFDILLGVQVSEEEIKNKTYEQQRTGTIRSTGTRTVIGQIIQLLEITTFQMPLLLFPKTTLTSRLL